MRNINPTKKTRILRSPLPEARKILRSLLPEARKILRSPLPEARKILRSLLPEARKILRSLLPEARKLSQSLHGTLNIYILQNRISVELLLVGGIIIILNIYIVFIIKRELDVFNYKMQFDWLINFLTVLSS
jgi:DNA-binding MarR family transcriptional regulator